MPLDSASSLSRGVGTEAIRIWRKLRTLRSWGTLSDLLSKSFPLLRIQSQCQFCKVVSYTLPRRSLPEDLIGSLLPFKNAFSLFSDFKLWEGRAHTCVLFGSPAGLRTVPYPDQIGECTWYRPAWGRGNGREAEAGEMRGGGGERLMFRAQEWTWPDSVMPRHSWAGL